MLAFSRPFTSSPSCLAKLPSLSLLSSQRFFSSLPPTMKAWVLESTGKDYKMHIQELKMPIPRANEVLVKNRACGVCHTDLHVMKDEVKFPFPAVLGHEASGHIVSIGAGTNLEAARRLQVGSPVVSTFIMPCNTCHSCESNQEDLCSNFFALNRGKGALYDGETRLFRTDGRPLAMYSMAGLAEYSVVPVSGVYQLQPAMKVDDACILGCAVFTAFGALKHAGKVQVGENVAVIGVGGVGGNVLQMSRNCFGANLVIAVDIDAAKLQKAKELGATHVINAKKENVIERMKEITGERGVQVCVEALGHPATFSQTVQCIADGGRCVMVGIAPQGVMGEVEITRLVRRKISIIGSFGAKARQDTPTIINFVHQGKISLADSITKRYKFQDAAKAYDSLDKGLTVGRSIIDFTL